MHSRLRVRVSLNTLCEECSRRTLSPGLMVSRSIIRVCHMSRFFRMPCERSMTGGTSMISMTTPAARMRCSTR